MGEGATRVLRVMCVDDSPDICGLCRRLVNAEPDMECVGVLHSADGLVEAVLGARPEVVLLDLTMPGKDPLVAVRDLAEAAPWCRVLAFSGHDDPDRVQAAADAGAWGLVSKGAEPRELLASIRRVAEGEFISER